MNAAKNFVIPLAVVPVEMTSIDKAEDVAFSFASSFAQVLLSGALVDVIDEVFPALALTNAIGVVGEVGCVKQRFVIAGNRWVTQAGRS
ncbi:hypothetical protein D3C77_186590 [compost metagenome]